MFLDEITTQHSKYKIIENQLRFVWLIFVSESDDFVGLKIFQVIPGNLQQYVSTNRSLLQYKTLPAYFSYIMMVYCLLNVT